MTVDRYPEALFTCGALHGESACSQPLFVKLSLSDNAIYMCTRGHRLGAVSDVDHYLMATALGALSRPDVRQKLCVAVDGGIASVELVEPRRAFADWWEDASPGERYDVMATAIDRVVVAPESMFDLDVLPVVAVHWKEASS